MAVYWPLKRYVRIGILWIENYTLLIINLSLQQNLRRLKHLKRHFM